MTVIFVTGTDTDIGKTVVTSLLVSFFKTHGHDFFPFKPIQSGAIQRDGEWIAPDPEMYQLVIGQQALTDTNTYLLEKPFSPHLAAKHAHVQFDFDFMQHEVKRLQNLYDGVVVEGAGGLYVPLTEDGYCMIDWLEKLCVPTIVVAKAGVGTINHTVLSVEALVRRGITVAGIIVNHLREEDVEVVADNIQMIEKLTNVPVIGTVPYCENMRDVLMDEAKRKECHANWAIDRMREAFADGSTTIA